LKAVNIVVDNLTRLGWSPLFQADFDRISSPGDRPGRVTVAYGGGLTAETSDGQQAAEITSTLRKTTSVPEGLPAVGDWVVLRGSQPASVVAVLPRRGALTRKVAGLVTEGQVLAANVDLILVVASLAARLRRRGIERYLTMAWESGALPVVVLTKSDLVEDAEASVAEIQQVAIGVDVYAVSGTSGEGVGAIEARLRAGITAVVVGPSGAGKSTLINRLAGDDRILTGEVSDDHKGRHTTTHRELHQLESGAMIIDTPGLRELQLWHSKEGLSRTFSDIEALAAECRFGDCAHDGEPGCAVAVAIATGVLSLDRLLGYRKLERELMVLEGRRDGRAQRERRRQIRVQSKALRQGPSKPA
jgi:ribosome biogenesis GTPase / thiamine phosphate phosphatase